MIDLIELLLMAVIGRINVVMMDVTETKNVTPKKVYEPKEIEVEEPKKVEEVKEEETTTSPFTATEIGFVVSRMGKDMTARLTPHGNIILQHKNSTKTLFAIYKRENGYLIRRRLGYDNPYGSGNVLNGGNTFDTLNDAMNYFAEYREKYPNSLL